MPHPLSATWRLFRAAVVAGSLGLATLLAAVAVAGSRFDHCGASRLDAVDPACRLGAQLLAGAYVLLGMALVLGALSLSLLWRVRRQRRGR